MSRRITFLFTPIREGRTLHTNQLAKKRRISPIFIDLRTLAKTIGDGTVRSLRPYAEKAKRRRAAALQTPTRESREFPLAESQEFTRWRDLPGFVGILPGRQTMFQDENYCWTVSCKNRWFHLLHNFRLNHRIPLGITDDFAACPKRDEGQFAARCNVCGKEYIYKPSDVRRTRQELPDRFVAHPRFW